MTTELMNPAMMPQAAFIVYRDLLIWPTTDDDGHCAEIIGVEGEDLRERLSDILTRSVNAIRGEPEPLSLHSWHDLPELIEALRVDAALLDWLTAKGVEYGGGWHARENVANRGYRLHQGRVGGFETPRVAISAAIAAEGKTP